jgi:hypothetical protein
MGPGAKRRENSGIDIMFRHLMALAAAGALALSGAPAMAQEKSASKPDFHFPATGPVRILVFRPDVQVGEQSTGGMNKPDAEWTEQARTYSGQALAAEQAARSNELVLMPELEGDDAAVLADYRALFRAVTDAVIQHKLFKGNRLPTKRDQFDWTLGPGVSRLADIGGGDYGLFIYTYDSYGSAGRKAAQVVGALFGAVIIAGVHIGHAGLVDLRTGELVWINADLRMGGNVRDAEGATKRVKQLLEDFPTRLGAAPPAAASTASK